MSWDDKQSSGSAAKRQRVLAEWRGIDLAPLEKAQAVNSKPAGLLLKQILSRFNLDRRRSDVEIVKAWNALLDPQITAHAQPINLHKGTLFVKVDSSVWLSEIIVYRRKEILERMQHCFGQDFIVEVSFRAG
jgi:hypothetical protein